MIQTRIDGDLINNGGCEDGDRWTDLRDIQEVELANLVIIGRGEKGKGVRKNAEGSDLGTEEKDNTVH